MNIITYPHSAAVRWRAGAIVAFLIAVLLLVPLSGVANAAQADADAHDQSQVVLSGRVVVPAGESVDEVVIMHGAATIDGVVRGSLVVFDGPATVAGEVAGDVVAFNGAVTVAQGARIGGDLVAPRAPQIAEGATIGGDVRRLTTNRSLDEMVVSRWVSWIAVSVSTLALGLLLVIFAPRAADAAVRTARTRPGATLGWVRPSPSAYPPSRSWPSSRWSASPSASASCWRSRCCTPEHGLAALSAGHRAPGRQPPA